MGRRGERIKFFWNKERRVFGRVENLLGRGRG